MRLSTPFRGEVYFHYCPVSGKGYVGQTINGLTRRWCDQVKVTRWPKHVGYNYPLSRAIRKYGPGAFKHQILAVARTKAELDNLERVWIILLQTRDSGYNLAGGGEGNPGLKHTDKSKEKISRNRKGKGTGYTFNRGRVKTEETRQKISVAGKGKKRTAETCARMSAARTGIARPDVTAWNNRRWSNPAERERMRKLNLGKSLLPETKEKIREARLGKKLSDATKTKISLAGTGQPWSDSERAARIKNPQIRDSLGHFIMQEKK